jgi:hypothetical protein
VAEEAVELFFQLAPADGFANLRALVLGADVGLAAGNALHDMPAGLGAERFGDATIADRLDLVAEVRTERIGWEPAQITTLAAAVGVLGGLLGGGLEVGATDDARAQGVNLGLGCRLVLVFSDAHQDVAGMVFGDQLLLASSGGITDLDQLEQLEAAGAAQRADDIARLHATDQLGESIGDFIQAAPAQITAFQSIGAVRIAHRSGGEVQFALVDQVLDAFDLLLAGGDLLGIGAFRQADQDVCQMVLGTGVGLLGKWMVISSCTELRKSA